MFEAALGTALAFIFLFSYFGFRRVAGYAALVDIAVFALCVWLFSGTYAGMMTGMIAGLFISLFLKSVRKSVGYEKVSLKRKKGDLLPRMVWIAHKD
jgi:hypothetical protein